MPAVCGKIFIFPSEATQKFIFVMAERRKFKKCRGISYIYYHLTLFKTNVNPSNQKQKGEHYVSLPYFY
ncbi:hypothetical protein A3A25_00290 [Candidatus Azambacteria bacterium RIFCSPLOWO2_01_FULL_46_26]|uniref:Uncharacterized protein n=1 Tax=Candidatus Azambacteria bacterium RIFCSPLOWO2_01_FULL_46_26 TaxID=1797299 RepID=A0A1F5C8C3_9BACT|nr:MAG: hypothetical protein A3A25_00290 [Candidatus Azambacteria bacterium RIFCSPLOWO2_01_FULL_46_26]